MLPVHPSHCKHTKCPFITCSKTFSEGRRPLWMAATASWPLSLSLVPPSPWRLPETSTQAVLRRDMEKTHCMGGTGEDTTTGERGDRWESSKGSAHVSSLLLHIKFYYHETLEQSYKVGFDKKIDIETCSWFAHRFEIRIHLSWLSFPCLFL